MAETLKLHDSVESVVVLKARPDGRYEAVEVYEPEGVSRRTTKRFRRLERVVHRVVRSQQRTLQSYSDRHQRSAARKKNGWLKDFRKNVSASMKQGRKSLKLKSLF
jgi:hypothetical protein